MRRTVKAWVVVDERGRIPFHGPIQNPLDGPVGKKRGDVESWGNQPGDTIVRATITYDDGRPSRSGAKRTKGGRRG